MWLWGCLCLHLHQLQVPAKNSHQSYPTSFNTTSTRLHNNTVKVSENKHRGEVYLFSDSTRVSNTTRRSLRAICSWRSWGASGTRGTGWTLHRREDTVRWVKMFHLQTLKCSVLKNNKFLPFDQRLRFHLSHQVDQASPEESAEELIMFLYSNIWPQLVVVAAARTCSPTGPGGPGNPLDPSSPFWPNRPCWPLGPGSPSAPWGTVRK